MDNMDRKIEKKKGLQRKHIIWIAGGVLFLFLLFQIFRNAGTRSLKVDSDKITISEVTRGQFNDYIRVTGQVEPISTIYLDAEEGGRVTERLIEEGAMVKAGDVIVRLETTPSTRISCQANQPGAEREHAKTNPHELRNQMIETRRRLLQTHYDIQKKQRNFEQQQSLYNDKLVAREAFLQAKEDYEYSLQEQKINRQKPKTIRSSW